MSDPLEQPSAVRSLYDSATTSHGVAAELLHEIEAHGGCTLAFTRAWMADPALSDPSLVHAGFGRVALLHQQLRDLLDQQREALISLPARLVVAEDPGREEVLAELELRGLKPA